MTTAAEATPIVCGRCGAVSTRAAAQYCAACGNSLQPSRARWRVAAVVIGVCCFAFAFAALFLVHVSSPSMTSSVTRSTVTAVSVDLNSAPTALLQGGPTADQMSLNGLSLGSPLPTDRRIDGNEFLVAGDRVSQIAIGRSDLLRACGVRGERDIPRRFGNEPTSVQRDGAFVSYDYAARGITVEWDARIRQINRIILRPTTHE